MIAIQCVTAVDTFDCPDMRPLSMRSQLLAQRGQTKYRRDGGLNRTQTKQASTQGEKKAVW